MSESRTSRRRLAPVLLLAALAWAAVPGCKKPVVHIRDVEVESLDLKKMDLVLVFDVTNPNLLTVRLYDFRYDLTVRGESFLTGQMPTPINSIAPDKTSIFRLPIRVPYANLAALAGEADPADWLPYELTTRATFNVLGVPVAVVNRRGGRIPPVRALVPRLRAVRLRPQEAILELAFDVENANAFPLHLRRLDGGLYLSDEKVLTVYRTAEAEFPAEQTVEFRLAIRVDATALLKAAARSAVGIEKIQFRGEFILDAPEPLSRMLTGEEGDR